MGTPCACAYATIFFAYYERTSILPKYKENIVLYLRYIDDILLIWKDLPTKPTAFTSFAHDIDNQCNLKWKTEELSDKTNFLDLTIMLDRSKGRCITRTFQKELNLFLYMLNSITSTLGSKVHTSTNIDVN